MKRLSTESLAQLPPQVQTPRYDRDSTDIGIVHLGIGAFHRAHQALYTEQVLNETGGAWGICGVSLRSATVRDQLAPQDCLYTVSVNSDAGRKLQLVGAVKTVLVASESPSAVIEALCLPSVHVVTLTITEKGYCLNPASGRLNESHPDIRHDLAYPDQPITAIGFIARALEHRRKNGQAGLTIISCDNWFANGKRLGQAVLDFSTLVDTELQTWIADHCRFPCTMVDRIVPVTTLEDRERIGNTLGHEDQACVMTEPFSQWVIEDNFAGPVPDWRSAGATLVSDVQPFEKMKLRMLNGSHSTLAYLACLARIDTVSEAITHPEIRLLVEKLMREEMVPTLSLPGSFDLDAYADQLLQRFANTALHHQTRQIAMDGSQKIPQRLLPALNDYLQKGESSAAIMLGIAAWIRYTRGIDESGIRYQLDDPLSEQLEILHEACGPDVESYLPAILGISEVFDVELKNNLLFSKGLREALDTLESLGALATARLVGDKTNG
ncbi:MAG: mannitol dehydrogenase family protein [Halioglobus sp.]